MTRDAFIARIVAASERWPSLNHQELERLRRRLRQTPEEGQFDALVAAFVDPPRNTCLAQEYAGRLLEVLNPKPRVPLDELLLLVLPGWDPSIEQLPTYLRNRFGDDIVVAALARLDEASAVKPELTEAVRFWLRSPRSPGKQSVCS